MPTPNSISADKLSRLIGTAAAPLLLDVREDSGTTLLPASLPVPAGAIGEWTARLTGRAVIVIDEDGARTAPGLAAWLRSDVIETARRFDAAAFDVAHDDVFWSHRGERCTFDLMVETFGLTAFPALDYLATIVRGADTARPDIVPEAAGLLALSLGLSRVHADDLEQLEAGMPIYDALYRWCRDARSETHDWTSHKPRQVQA